MKLSKLLKSLLMPFMFSVVETTDDGDVIGTGNDARLKLFNQIADNADKLKGEDFQNVNDDGTTEPFEIEESAESKTEVEEEPEEEEEQPLVETKTEKTPDKPLTTPPSKYKITVNGKEKEVTIEEALAIAQKVESADEYLREAAELNKSTKSLKGTPEATPKVETEELDDVTLARKLQMGSEEEAAAAIRSLRKPTGPSSDDLGTTIDERLNFRDAVRVFQDEYKDIVSDPVLSQLAIQADNSMRAQGDQRPYIERYREIGKNLREWVASKTPVPETKAESEPKVEVSATKKTRKEEVPSVPKSAHGKVADPVEEETDESTQDVIANMAKARGGPQWMRS